MRNKLNKAQLEEMSLIIEQKIRDVDEIKKAKSIFVYVSFRSEVKTLSLIESFLSQSKNVVVPFVSVEKKKMDAVQIINIKNDLAPGYNGILEPTRERVTQFTFPPEKIDVVLFPGSVFDEQGGRFGYGGGYYDRFVENIYQAIRIGLAFDFQIVKNLALQPHDQIMDIIISEKRTITTNRRS